MIRQSDRMLRDRIAEEAQLLAEEKWIIEALTKIKQQKNCLQIERLQLESLESKLRQNLDENLSENKSQDHATKSKAKNPALVTAGRTRNSIEFEVPLISETDSQNLDLDSCNDEELNLAVSKSVFSKELKDNVLEEFEEDEDEEMFDMNMLFN